MVIAAVWADSSARTRATTARPRVTWSIAEARIITWPTGVVSAGPAAVATETNDVTRASSSATPAPTSVEAAVRTVAIS
ncbi:hypothetical protein [Rhodococcus kronopolitis]|uniref:Uncharacterized protein n=1 Tax=Rhodococcus kronopolitis TaxID=1460226 RepID=A0ABV9FNJ9_9NOCA